MFKEKKSTIDQEEIEANPAIKNIRDKREELWQKIGAVAFGDLMVDFLNLLKENGVNRKEAEKYKAFHIFLASGTGDLAQFPFFDFKGKLSIEKFLDDNLTKAKEEQKEEK